MKFKIGDIVSGTRKDFTGVITNTMMFPTMYNVRSVIGDTLWFSEEYIELVDESIKHKHLLKLSGNDHEKLPV